MFAAHSSHPAVCEHVTIELTAATMATTAATFGTDAALGFGAFSWLYTHLPSWTQPVRF